MYTDETITKTGSDYTGDSLKTVNKFKTGINKAIEDIAKYRFKLDYKENITLDSNKQFSLSSLTKSFYKLIKVVENDTNTENYKTKIEAYLIPDNKIECPTKNAGDIVTVYYYYIQTLSNLTDVFPFTTQVDWRIPCYMGAYSYLALENDVVSLDRANIYLGLYNDAYNNINQNRVEMGRVKVKDVYGVM